MRWAISLAVMTFLLFSSSCQPALQPTSSAARAVVFEKEIITTEDGEVILSLSAGAPGANWDTRFAEAATVSVHVDGVYQADVVLHQGGQLFTYEVMLGRLQRGNHRLAVIYEPGKSSSQALQAVVDQATVRVITSSDPLFPVIAHAPYLYGRDTSNYSDTPLWTYHEIGAEGTNTVITYTIIFSNEDGGTAPDGLMARWGRLADIEWFYRVVLDPAGGIMREEFQGQNHATSPFKGVKADLHPLLKDITRNNVFGDSGTSRFRFALPPVDLLGGTAREELLDRYPWMYRVVGEEWLREQPHGTEKTPNPASREVSDPRYYAYLEFKSGPASGQTCDGKLAFQLKLKGSDTWYSSDHDQDALRIQSEGWRRSTIELPPGTDGSQLEALQVRMYPGSNRTCSLLFTNLRKLFLLGTDYHPGANLLEWTAQQMLDADPATPAPDRFIIPISPSR